MINGATDAKPLVSVVIPAFNAAATIGRAIESARRQDYRPIEIIVVDDASTDETTAVLETLSGDDLRVVALASNKGAAQARNEGIRAARGEYIAFLDADDAWHSTKLSKQVSLIEANRSLTLVSCDSVLMYDDGSHSQSTYAFRPPREGGEAWKALLAYNFIPTPTVLARRTDLVRLGGFDCRLVVGEDLDLWLRLSMHGQVGVIAEVLTYVHDRPNSLMKSCKDGERDFVLPMIIKHLLSHSHEMTALETRQILGRRYFDFACNLLYAREPRCITFFWHAMKFCYRPIRVLSVLPRAAVITLIAAIMRQFDRQKRVGRLVRIREISDG